MVAIGTLIAYWIDYGCLYGPDNFTWRFPIAFQCVFAVIVLVLMISLPLAAAVRSRPRLY
jgi:hypothetical protein